MFHQPKEHAHPHAHQHLPSRYGRTFLTAVLANAAFVVVELCYGYAANSTALVADASHNLSDVLGLLLAWGAIVLAGQSPKGRYTFGFRGSTIMAALANAAFLLVACGAIAAEAVHRLSAPSASAVAGATVSGVAAVGIVINGLSAWMLAKGSRRDINVRGAYLHMLADAAVSAGVVVTGWVIAQTGWQWLDPLASLLISAVMVHGTWGLLKESLRLAINAAPASMDLAAVQAHLRALAGVTDVHDLHVWAISTTENALTAHLVMPSGYPGDAFMEAVATALREDFHIHHSTLQIEQGTTQHPCALVQVQVQAPAHAPSS